MADIGNEIQNIQDFERHKFYVDANGKVLVQTTTAAEIAGESNGVIDDNNSTHTPINAGLTFTGSATDILDYSIIYVTVYSDVASATDGLVIEQGHTETDIAGIDWDSDDKYTIPAGIGKTYAIQPALQYLRVRYTNGGTNQTAFRLHVLAKKKYSLDSSHRIQDPIVDDDDARLVKAVVTAKTEAGDFINASATNDGNIKISNAENGLGIAKGNVTGTTFIHKFGSIPDMDDGDSPASVYDGADDAHIDQMSYVYSTTADIDSLSSDSASDTFDIEVQGLDTNYDVVIQTITLTGQTRVALTTNLIRVFRMKNVGTANNVGHIYCYVNTALTTGTPNDSTKVRAVMQPGNNQTLMAIYTIPNGKTGFVRDWYASTSGASRNTNYVMDLFARPFGKVFQLKHRTAISDNATSYIQHKYEEPEVFAAKTDIEIRASITDSPITGGSVSAGFDIVLVDD